jgi:hypothetical protein
MAGYLTHSEPRFFLFFLECAMKGDEKLLDFLGIFFLSDLPTQIPHRSVLYSGHPGNFPS